jgi:hypothetical protein
MRRRIKTTCRAGDIAREESGGGLKRIAIREVERMWLDLGGENRLLNTDHLLEIRVRANRLEAIFPDTHHVIIHNFSDPAEALSALERIRADLREDRSRL